MTDHEQRLNQVNRSGFPFQFRVMEEIRHTSPSHHWSVSGWELPWSNGTGGTSGFIDLVIEKDSEGSLIALETKRVRADDVRQLQWIFLIPEDLYHHTTIASCFELELIREERDRPEDIRVWDNVNIVPSSYEADMCILAGDEPKNRPLLESLARQVLDSVEGLAQEEFNNWKSKPTNLSLRRFIFPMIVTNAEIVTCTFKPRSIRIPDGTIDPSSADFAVVPYIRFRKNLSTNSRLEYFPSGAAHNTGREQTVFVVNAAHLPELLQHWAMSPRETFALQRILKVRDIR